MNYKREYWTTLDGTNGYYEISSWGNVRNANTKRLKTILTREIKGHPIAVFTTDLKGQGTRYHYLGNEVFKHFSKYPCRRKKFWVKHIDGDWMNCRISNLIVLPHVFKVPHVDVIKLYEEKGYSTIKSIVYGHYFKMLPLNSGFDFEDFIQEGMLDLWKMLADYTADTSWNVFVWNSMRFTAKRVISTYYKHLHLELFDDRLAYEQEFFAQLGE